MSSFLRLAALLVFARVIVAAPAASDCTGTISSLDDVAAAVKCTTVNINSFTVPAGETFNLALADGTTVNMRASADPSGSSAQFSSPIPGVTCRGRRDLRRQGLGGAALPSQVGFAHCARRSVSLKGLAQWEVDHM